METPCGSTVRRLVIYFVANIIFFSSEALGWQDDPVGIADRNIIPDNRFTASSYYDSRYAPMNARLNGAARGWAPRIATNPNDYLQIDLDQVFVISAVATQGANGRNEWTTEYKISTSIDKNAMVWATYKNGMADKLFPGNTDSNAVVKNVLGVPALVRYIRFIPTAYHSWKTMRVETYGFMKDLQWTSPAPTVDNITSTSAIVRWGNTTGSPLQANLTFYIIKYQDNNTTRTLNVSGFETSVNITGLSPNTNYSVIIKAVNKAGHGPWSCSTNFTTLPDRPYGDPLSVTAYPLSSQSVRVTWHASKCGSNGPIRGYKIMCTAISMNVTKEYVTSANQTSYNITSLEKWTEYRITVKCFNDNGEGPASAEVTVRTMEDAPGRPEHFEVTVLSSSCIQLDWALPSEANGIIRGFRMRYEKLVKSNGFLRNTTLPGNGTLSYVLTGLDSCTTYSFKILAYTIKDGPYTHEIQRTTAENVCQSDAIGIADPNIIPDDKFTATSWYGVSNEPWAARLYGTDDGWAPNSQSDPYDFLQIYLGQVFVVCAVATQGCNGCHKRTTQYKISTSVDKNARVWAIYKNGIADKLFPGNTDSNTVVKNVLGVPALVRYIRFIPTAYHSWKTMRVEAYGFMKDLQWTSPAPTVDNITSTSAIVRWRNTTGNPLQANITFYIIKYQDNSTTRTLNVSGFETSVNNSGLTPYTNYSVMIKAVNKAGHGQWSCSTNFTTLVEILPYGAPVSALAYSLSSQSLRVTWDASKCGSNGPNTSTVVKNVLNIPVLARYIRFIPIAYYSWKTLRVEAYGYIRDLQWTSPAPTVENITSTSAAVRWRKITESPLQANITFYIVKYHTNNNTRISNVSGSEASVVDVTGLTPDTNYSVRIKAVSRNYHGQWSCPTSFITPGSDLPPCIAKQTQKETNEARREKKETTCISSSIVATSLAFNVAFLVFILLLVVYINHLKKQLEEAKKAEKRQMNAFNEVLYSNTNAIISEGSGLPMQQLPSYDNSTYEPIASCGIVTGAN
ncbi:protein sidekick-1-like [Actinia tenebrosa]|uniref:Protein sidekick-1-like n=1 Tax=Actinia tenebrosa TaxID=6105 RepID=A0A6P8HQ86_ACTTE|nr:protein sidekick-1-like [Actinia tenebrosa]